MYYLGLCLCGKLGYGVISLHEWVVRFLFQFPLRIVKVARLHQFARSLLYNATAGGALWWFRKSHIVSYAKHQHSPFARRRNDFRQAAARRFKLHFPPIVWWKFHENPFSRSRERLSYSFGGRKKQKKTKKKQKNKKTQLQNIYASASYRKAVA